MPDLWNRYYTEITTLKGNCEALKNIDPGNEHLQLVIFNSHKMISIKPEFWEKYGSKNNETNKYCLDALIEANKQLEETIRESRAIKMKGLIPESD